MKQIHEAVIVLGNKDGYARAAIAEGEHPVHAKFVGDGAKRAIEIAQIEAKTAEIPFDTRQVVAFFAGLMLFEVKNVAVIAIDEFGDGGVQSFAVGTLD